MQPKCQQVLPAQPAAMGSHHPAYDGPVPCTLQPWLFTATIDTHQQVWRSHLDGARADLTSPRHFQSPKGKAEVMERTQGVAGLFLLGSGMQVCRREK